MTRWALPRGAACISSISPHRGVPRCISVHLFGGHPGDELRSAHRAGSGRRGWRDLCRLEQLLPRAPLSYRGLVLRLELAPAR